MWVIPNPMDYPAMITSELTRFRQAPMNTNDAISKKVTNNVCKRWCYIGTQRDPVAFLDEIRGVAFIIHNLDVEPSGYLLQPFIY